MKKLVVQARGLHLKGKDKKLGFKKRSGQAKKKQIVQHRSPSAQAEDHLKKTNSCIKDKSNSKNPS